MKRKIPVVGMACAACAANVERKLQSINGVTSASVSLPTRTATVEWDEQTVTPEDMKREVNAIGFDLVIEDDRRVEELEQREYTLLKRQTLVAWLIAILVMTIGLGCLGELGILGNLGTSEKNQTALLLSLACIIYCGKTFYLNAWRQIIHRMPAMDTLVALSTGIAWLFSAYNTFWGESTWGARGMEWHTYFDASVMIITFVLTGRLIEQRTRKATASAISQLIGMTPKTARIYKGEKTTDDGTKQAVIEEVPIATIERGDVVEVSAGDRIPVDGTVTWATSFMKEDGAYVDESMVTGEPSPALKQTGSDTLAGTMLSQGRLRLRAKKTGDDTTLAHIIKMVEEAQGSKAPVQRTVDRIARVFVPVVAAAALVTFIAWWVAGGTQALPQAIISAVAVLVVACPCALGLATPTALMVGIGKAAKQNILVKDAAALERIRKVDAMVMDKTGTLTHPNPDIDFTKADTLAPEQRENLKPHAQEAISQLHDMGVEVYLMSGDKEEATAYWARKAGIKQVRSRVKPQDKEDLVKELQQQGHCVAMVGDGVNDSQALARADVSIAMAKGTDVAIDVAQMTLMGDDLRRIPQALEMSRKTVDMVRQNLFWAFIYNVVSIPLAAGAAHLAGIDFQITPAWASAMMACSSISVILNSLRLKWT
ncbi:MAG: heavy metal translocating P-type ATPase [Prevotella sp.]|nr:heavy metal translocating P-type ATPase [Prevotella sp.]